MSTEIYKLFKNTLPDIKRNEKLVIHILSDEENHIISIKDGAVLTGVSVINQNTIYLFCVEKSYQNQGIGSRLLYQTEEYISSKGFTKAILGEKDGGIVGSLQVSKETEGKGIGSVG